MLRLRALENITQVFESQQQPTQTELEILLTPGGQTTLRPCAPVAQWTAPWLDRDADVYVSWGLEQTFAMGSQSTYRVEVWTPPAAGGPTRGYSLVAVASEYCWQYLWAGTPALALQYAHSSAPLLQAGALCKIAELFGEQRDDADAKSAGYKHHWAHERAFDRALGAARERPA